MPRAPSLLWVGLCALECVACGPDLGSFGPPTQVDAGIAADVGGGDDAALADGGAPDDAGTAPVDVPPVTDTGAIGVDGAFADDVPVLVDGAPPPTDNGPTPRDAGSPPTDTGPACGAEGQGCCAGSPCGAGLECLAWGTTQRCGRCGGPGEPCCAGGTCAGSHAACQSLLGGELNVCASTTAAADTPGGSCNGFRTGTTCGPADTGCVPGNGFGQATCVACGYPGGPCCYGGHCDAGDSHCHGPYGGILVCE